MFVILIVVYTKGLEKFRGIAIGGIVGLDIFLFGLISGVSMNPARSLAPAVVSGYYIDLWLYLTAPFIGTTIVGLLLKKKFSLVMAIIAVHGEPEKVQARLLNLILKYNKCNI